MTKLLGKDDILKADDSLFEDVPVPEWGGVVRVVGMTGAERDRFEASFVKGRGRKQRTEFTDVRAKMVAWTVVNEKGERLFTSGDIPKLGQKSAAALSRVFNTAMRLSGMTDEDVEEITENFPNARNGASTSN